MLCPLVFNLEGVLGEAKNPTIDPAGRGKIAPQKIANGSVIGLEQEFFAEYKHSKMFERAHDGIQFDFVGRVVVIEAAEGTREEANGVLEAGVFESLLKHFTEGNAAAVSLKNEVALGIW